MPTKRISTKFSSIESVLKDIARGKMVVVVDDADRENEGDAAGVLRGGAQAEGLWAAVSEM